MVKLALILLLMSGSNYPLEQSLSYSLENPTSAETGFAVTPLLLLWALEQCILMKKNIAVVGRITRKEKDEGSYVEK